MTLHHTVARPSVAAVGMFDGVHMGHCTLVHTLVDEARRRNARSLVLTFSRHPLELLRPDEVPPTLCSRSLRCERLIELGVDSVEFLDFTPALRALTGREFLRLLRRRYGVTALVVGFNNHFGSDRLDASAARLVGAEEGVEIIPAEPLLLSDKSGVSSSRIRRAVAEGDVDVAARLLGRPYAIEGTVAHGEALGRKLGFPTANLIPADPDAALPAPGVYAVDVEIPHLGIRRRGVTNIGHRPSVAGADGSLTIETYILDFDGDVYSRPLRLHFLRRLRREQRFPSLEALRAQIAADARAARLA
ncbi:MAG: riboflavin biosynthesis protein RibF [Muribaculaceae bacterium]|nr:riboflavin biosynthesis protein RibF [Muribaculaceae bacterium]